MALINPCNLAISTANTYSDCDAAMLYTRQTWLMPKSLKWTATDLLNFTSYLDTQRHATGTSRVYPIFGSGIPIRQITDANEADVIETFEDGAKSFVRRGMMSRTFFTDKGGLYLAQQLQKIARTQSFIEVDGDVPSKVAMMANSDGTYSGFPTNLVFSPAPELANLKTVYKNKLMLDFNPLDYVGKGRIWKADSTEDILSLNGLLDSQVTGAVAPNTPSTTHIFLGVSTIWSQTDLVALYNGTGAGKIDQVSHFVVKAANVSTITPSGVAITNGQVDLTGVYTTGTNITVSLAAPSVLKANGLPGYEGTLSATIPIP